jgi:hypothetical protein
MIRIYLEKILKTPPRELIPRVRKKIKEKINDQRVRNRYLFNDSRLSFLTPEITNSYLAVKDLDTCGLDKQVVSYLIEMYLDHRFDLLGSGWVCNNYFSQCLGVEGKSYPQTPDFTIGPDGEWLKHLLSPRHFPKGQQIYRKISENYSPIDWQRDYKSAFRWNQQKWHLEQRALTPPGADIKVPWELSRFQHLPQLAIFARVFPERKKELVLEFRSQVLDFIAANPPFMGVCWVCPMDVGIGAANLLLAYDLFTQLDDSGDLDADFKKIFAEDIYSRGKFILYNLEFSEKLTSNHYLSNIAGLLFISSYLKESHETTSWLAFSLQEFFQEFSKQFHSDGTNFEASTSYHRLSGELVIYSIALIKALSNERLHSLSTLSINKWPYKVGLKPLRFTQTLRERFFTKTFIDKVMRIGDFTDHITKPTGNVAQIGDNDSGRFFRLSPNGAFMTNREAENTFLNLRNYCDFAEDHKDKGLFWDENILNHETMLSAATALFRSSSFESAAKRFPLEFSVIRGITKNKMFEAAGLHEVKFFQSPAKQTLSYRKELQIGAVKPDVDLLEGIRAYGYCDSGWYILKSDKLFLMICAGPNGQNDNGGHAHNDKLSIELNLDGKDLAVDPGTYLYTPIPEWRNRFRSVSAHPTLQTGAEQNTWSHDATGLFSLRNETTCEVVAFQKDTISVTVKYRDVIQNRTVKVWRDKIIITDRSTVPFDNNLRPFTWFSSGYGKIQMFNPDLSTVKLEE